MDLKLIYGNMRALCEAPQMMLHYADIPYEYKMVWDHYGSSWAEVKKDIIFNRLPILIINEDKYLWQSNTIIRYLSNLTKTKPSDEFQLAYCDAVFESTHEMFSPLNPTINMTFGEKFNANKKKLLEDILPNSLNNFEKLLQNSSGNFFIGNDPFYCDFNAYHHFSMCLILDKNIFSNFPNLKKFINNFEKLNNIKNYLDGRPELVELGTSPHFLIDGKKIPTGLNPNKKY
ncbi:glutathione S-transferase family protein [Pelagibacteraceae bacterium]|nr:glutathione S-transferase family protein [Pelagibacteraceae bacterium]